MPLVRPFSGRVVRPEWAARVVRPLEGDLGLDRLFDLAAYSPERQTAYLYRIRHGGTSRTAVVVLVAADGFARGQVLAHEAVQPDRVARLVDVFDAVPFRSDLVSLVHRHRPGLADAVELASHQPPLLEFTDPSGAEQAVYALGPAECEAITAALAGLQLYVADGHHRVAASLRRWERARRPDHAMPCAVYAEDQVELHAFHRRVRGPVDGRDLLDRLSKAYSVEPTSGPTQERGKLGIYLEGRWCRAEPIVPQRLPGVAGLDVTLLDEHVLGPLLGVARGDPRLEPVPELVDVDTSTRRCDEDGGVLFTLRAPTVADLMEVAERGEVMSAKTTYVQPKPRTGVFLSHRA